MMKILLLLFATSLIISSTQAQTSVYHPFPDSNAIWRGIHSSWGGGIVSVSYYRQFINGDTIIAGNTYHKIYEDGIHQMDTFPPVFYSAVYKAAYRTNLNRQLFYFNSGYNQDVLLYDFNKNIGDTFPCGLINCTNYLVASIDSVFDGLGFRKRFNILDLSSGCTNCYIPVIEGIGSINGLISNFLQPFESSSQLSCFFQDGIQRYVYDSLNCNMFTNVNDLNLQISAFISPNPLHNQTVFHLTPFTKSQLTIYNDIGRVIQSILIMEESTVIDMNSSPSGIYFYKLTSKNGKTLGGKFIVE